MFLPHFGLNPQKRELWPSGSRPFYTSFFSSSRKRSLQCAWQSDICFTLFLMGRIRIIASDRSSSYSTSSDGSGVPNFLPLVSTIFRTTFAFPSCRLPIRSGTVSSDSQEPSVPPWQVGEEDLPCNHITYRTYRT